MLSIKRGCDIYLFIFQLSAWTVSCSSFHSTAWWPGCPSECKGHLRNKMDRNTVINQHSLLKMSTLHRAKPQGKEKSHDISRNATGSCVASLRIMRWEGKMNVAGVAWGVKKTPCPVWVENFQKTWLCSHVLKEFSQNSIVPIQFCLLLRSFLEWHPRTMLSARGRGRRQIPKAWAAGRRHGAAQSERVKRDLPGPSNHCPFLSLRGLAKNYTSQSNGLD